MRAILCKGFGPLEQLRFEDHVPRELGPRDVRIRTAVATLGFMDTLMARGLYQLKPPLPYVPGAVSSGIVLEVGAAVDTVKPGERVSVLEYHGGFTEERVCDIDAVVRLPDSVDFEQGAAFRLAYSPAYYALVRRANLQPGETLVVTGASGGIGLAAVELGRVLGARVIGAVGSAEKAAVVRARGAEEVIVLDRENLKERVNALTDGRGADVIFEVVGGDVFDQCLRCIAMHGRICVLGFTSGRIAMAPTNLPLLKNASIVGCFLGGWMTRDVPGIKALNQTLVDMLAAGKLSALIGARYPLADTVRAMQDLLARKITGKIMLVAE